MTVLTQSNIMAAQDMDGAATNFAFTFRALVEVPEAVKAIILNTVTDVSTDLIYNDGGADGFTVAVDADGIGGSITVNDARSADYDITIYREYDYTQESNYADYNAFPADTVEDDYDKGTMIDQQQTEIISRALVLPITVTGVDTTLPIPEAGRPIGWNDAADGLTNYPDLIYQSQIDTDATPDFIGALSSDGVIRSGAGITYTDGGDFITLTADPTTINHDLLLGFVANEHIDHTAVTLTAGTGLSGTGDISANRTFAVTADYAVITANDGTTDITATEMETLTDTSNADALHTHATITDDRVKVDAAATRDYIGATSGDGVLRTSTGLSYADGGNFVTLAVDADYTDISANDAATDITGAELESLTAAGNADALHTHSSAGLTDVAISDLADGTPGELITWDGANAPAVVATGTANQVLTSNGAGLPPTFQNAGAGFADPMTTRGDIIIRDATNTTARLGIGANTFVLTSDGTDISWSASGGGGSADSVTKSIAQANAFAIGDVVYNNAGTWTLADASTAAEAEVVGMVSATGNPFTLLLNGYISGISQVLVADTVYFVSEVGTTTNTLTATEPTISKPVIVTDSTSSGYFNNMRGLTGGGGGGGSLDDAYDNGSVITVDDGTIICNGTVPAGHVLQLNKTSGSQYALDVNCSTSSNTNAVRITVTNGNTNNLVLASTATSNGPIVSTSNSLTIGYAISINANSLTSGRYISTDAGGYCDPAGDWIDGSSTLDMKENVTEVSFTTENIDKLRPMKMFKYQRKVDKYKLDEKDPAKPKKVKFKTDVKKADPDYHEGYILDDPTTPEDLIYRDFDGDITGMSATRNVNFLLKVNKELIAVIDDLKSRIEALEVV